MAIQVFDRRDTKMPDIGLFRLRDLETNQDMWVNTSSKKVRQAFDRWWYQRQQDMVENMRRSRVDFVSVATDENYVKSLMALFKNRSTR